jgi:cation diffusion facilitator family transporter
MAPEPHSHAPVTEPGLVRYGVLAVAAALVTIGMKTTAYLLTGSVGLLSDALESSVNLVAAIVAVIALTVAARPPDPSHPFGHGKAEYFSAGVEGVMILAAAVAVIITAVNRLLHPQDLERLGVGLALTVASSIVNLVVALVLVRAGRRHRSITLVADGRHLLTDVWTSGGVVAGLVAVTVTGWTPLDPIIALVVGVNIVVAGVRLIRDSTGGLMDAALDPDDLATLEEVFGRHREHEGVDIHAVQTRAAGQERFVSIHLLVPGAWTVRRGHDLTRRLEVEVAEALPGASLFTHVEPIEDPASYDDPLADEPPHDPR